MSSLSRKKNSELEIAKGRVPISQDIKHNSSESSKTIMLVVSCNRNKLQSILATLSFLPSIAAAVSANPSTDPW
jgi:hypothetical protein